MRWLGPLLVMKAVVQSLAWMHVWITDSGSKQNIPWMHPKVFPSTPTRLAARHRHKDKDTTIILLVKSNHFCQLDVKLFMRLLLSFTTWIDYLLTTALERQFQMYSVLWVWVGVIFQCQSPLHCRFTRVLSWVYSIESMRWLCVQDRPHSQDLVHVSAKGMDICFCYCFIQCIALYVKFVFVLICFYFNCHDKL